MYFRYLSTLYSHPDWPNTHPRVVRDELRDNIDDNWVWMMLTPSWLYRHLKILAQKKRRGQPVSFTDFFGYLVGETILKDVSEKSQKTDWATNQPTNQPTNQLSDRPNDWPIDWAFDNHQSNRSNKQIIKQGSKLASKQQTNEQIRLSFGRSLYFLIQGV